jgi:hypothetical protein
MSELYRDWPREVIAALVVPLQEYTARPVFAAVDVLVLLDSLNMLLPPGGVATTEQSCIHRYKNGRARGCPPIRSHPPNVQRTVIRWPEENSGVYHGPWEPIPGTDQG